MEAELDILWFSNCSHFDQYTRNYYKYITRSSTRKLC